MDFSYLYLSTEGRIGRQTFWIGHIILAVIGIVLMLIVGALFGQFSFMTRLINFVFVIVVAYPAYAVSAKRFQDRGKPGKLGAILIGLSLFSTLLALVGLTGNPIAPNLFGTLLGFVTAAVAVWYLVELGILRGTIGDNQYGSDPVG